MDYVVLARKLRPSRFQDLIGQETVARSLRNAVLSGRTAHAYLFAGSRGVGKTSTARILTKAINCLDPQQGEPCNICTNCEEITHNASPDVLEIDAASNRGIDSIRELRDNTKYAPAKCAYKTYIIDEVHMLTMESFNALLKTLEEPPPHVKFILATTAVHRIPETILSRCQRYDFPRIPLGLMQEYLGRVTADEGIALSPAALEIIARNAAGGMRDALTAVDQVVAFAGNTPSDEQVLGILGVMDTREVLSLLGALLDKNLGQALEIFAAVVERGHDLTTLLEALLREVKDFSLYKSLGGKSSYFQDHAPTTLEFFSKRGGAVSLDELQQIFYLLLELEGQLKLSEHNWACFEMALVKACRVEPLVGVPELLAQVRDIMGGTAGGNPGGSLEGGPVAGGENHPPAQSAQPAAQSAQPAAQSAQPAAQASPRGREGGSLEGGAGSTSGQGEGGQDGEAEEDPGSSAAQPARPAAPPPAESPPQSAQPESNPAEAPPAESPAQPPPDAQSTAPSELPSPMASDASPPAQPVKAPMGAGEVESSPDAPAQSSDEPSPDAPAHSSDETALGQVSEAPPPDAQSTPPSTAPSLGEGEPEAVPPPEMETKTKTKTKIETPGQGGEAPSSDDAVPSPDGSSSDATAPSPDAPAPDPEAPPLDRPLPCEDARWGALVDAVRPTRRKLAADLRRVEVAAIGEAEVRIVPPDAGMELGRAELEFLRVPLKEAFGAAFQLLIDHDSNKKARHAYSLIGREEQIESARLENERRAAISDEKVQRVMRAFPQGKVEDVTHPQPPRNRRNDV